MKIEISATPVFNVPLTKEQVDVLIKMSKHHYDWRCIEASDDTITTRGFLIRWRNLIDNDALISADDPNPDEDYGFSVCASWADLDTCLKILEMRFVALSADVISKEEAAICTNLTFDFNGALSTANRKYSEWKTSFGE